MRFCNRRVCLGLSSKTLALFISCCKNFKATGEFNGMLSVRVGTITIIISRGTI